MSDASMHMIQGYVSFTHRVGYSLCEATIPYIGHHCSNHKVVPARPDKHVLDQSSS